MAIYDPFTPLQATNGTGPPNPQASSGAPGYSPGSWGHVPPNFSGGLQPFMGSPQAQALMARVQAARAQGGFGGLGGGLQMPQGAPPANLPQGTTNPTMLAGGGSPGGGFSSPMQPGGGFSPPMMQPGGGPVSVGGPQNTVNYGNLAGGMRPFLG